MALDQTTQHWPVAGCSSELNGSPQKRFDSLSDWLDWQETLHVKDIELGLERVQSVAQAMGLFKPPYTVISVAGTNGKGSSVALIDAVLTAAGYKTGCYTSPHLISYNERLRISGKNVSDEALCDAFDRIDRARNGLTLTYFEFGTLAAFDIFQRTDIDVGIFEVGLGGRLDAVNLLDADIALVTAIDIDHIDWLGEDRDSIAREKAGIFRHGTPAICSDPKPPQSLIDRAAALQSPLFCIGRDFEYVVSDNDWTWHYDSLTYADLPKPKLCGDHQLQNAAGVLMVFKLIAEKHPINNNALRTGLKALELPGRFQVIPGAIQYVLDVAHNRQAARVLAQNLTRLPRAKTTHILIGMLRDKDRRAVFQELRDVADVWHVATLNTTRGAGSETLAKELTELGVSKPIVTYESVAHAFADVVSAASSGDRVLVTGSFLTVGEAMRGLAQRLSA